MEFAKKVWLTEASGCGIEQGLKPNHSLWGFFGTTEVVP